MLVQKVKRTIEKYRMVEPGDQVVVGVSGGVDSVCLLQIMAELRDELQTGLIVAHLDHMFRLADAAGERRLVQAHAARLGLPCKVDSRDVPAMARSSGLSPQHAARIARYDFYDRVCEEFSAHKVAVGHNADDQAETVLVRLIQGAGSGGLAGIRPVRSGIIVRPLIETRRSEIEEFARANRLRFAQDPSNFKPVYLRNKIRLELLPLIKESYSPSVVEKLCALADVLNSDSDYLERSARSLLEEMAELGQSGEVVLDRKKLLAQHLAMKRLIVRLCFGSVARGSAASLSFRKVESILDLAGGARGAKLLDLGAAVEVACEYGKLLFRRSGERDSPGPPAIRLDVPGSTRADLFNLCFSAEVLQKNDPRLGRPGRFCAHLDYRELKGDLIVRSRLAGDRFRPLGMRGEKKIHDFFIDAKVPRGERDRVPLLAHLDDIVWVVGFRISEDRKVDDSTEEILKIEAKALSPLD